MKRGSTDVDWVIATGLFIVFLLSIFVFLKPGITAPHKPEALLDIVEDGIRKESAWRGTGIYWTLYEVPLYLKKDAGVVGDDCFKIPFDYVWSQDRFDLYKITGDNPLNPKQTPLPFRLDGTYIIFKPQLSSTDKEIFVLDYSKNPLFSQRIVSINVVSCAIDGGNEILIEEIGKSGKPNFEYSYGVIESIKGISAYAAKEGMIGYYQEDDGNRPDRYNKQLKEKMGFPFTKEFSVHIKSVGTSPPALCNNGECNFQPMPPEIDANIFVREWSDFILNYNGLRTPVTVNLRVW